MTRSTPCRTLAGLPIAIVAILFLTFAVMPAPAQTLNVLHAFTGGGDGAYVSAGLTPDAAGNFYGTTFGGGSYGCGGLGCGTVYRLVRHGSSWTETPIFVFHGGSDGGYPWGRVIFGPDGSLYGTAEVGGAGQCGFGGVPGCGVVYRLQPPPTTCKSILCYWKETVLYSFAGGSDGANPAAEVAFDAAGNLYGTTLGGGAQNKCDGGCGTVFELSPNKDGSWSETRLYAFQWGTTDGATPAGGVVLDAAGNVYGTTVDGGPGCYSEGCGAVYKLTASGSGWSESILQFFNGTGLAEPEGGLIFDRARNLYGVTAGYAPSGGVYELSPGQGGWTFTTLHAFQSGEAANSWARLTLDPSGNLYGASQQGGAYGNGTVFKLTPSNGAWTYSSMHDFNLNANEPGTLYGAVVLDASGNIYGTADAGPFDEGGEGAAFEITP